MNVKCNFIEINVALVLSCFKMVKKGNSLCERMKGYFLLLVNIL